MAPSIRHYFVDEAGDAVLFDRRGRVIIGQAGCSKFFILGLLDTPNPKALGSDLDGLRASLLADPYFRDVPSMQAKARKTALAFHAKDDLPEVRREVFALLGQHTDLRFFAVIRDKRKLLEYVRQRNERQAAYRYQANELYDYLVRLLFQDRLHKDDAYKITFAKRGRSDRTSALKQSLHTARQTFAKRFSIVSDAPIDLIPSTPPASPGLQATDYFLWALQRLYERREERFLALLWPSFRLVRDLDDTREARYGVYYTQKRPLTLAALDDVPGI